MKPVLVLVIVATATSTLSAVKIASPAYSLNIVHHPHGGQSVYNPFFKGTYNTEYNGHGPGSSYFG